MPRMLKQVEGANKVYLGEVELFKTYNNKYNLSPAEFKLIVRTFFLLLSYSVIDTGNIYLLPKKLGTFSVRKKPTFGRGRFNYKLYKETGIKQ